MDLSLSPYDAGKSWRWKVYGRCGPDGLDFIRVCWCAYVIDHQ